MSADFTTVKLQDIADLKGGYAFKSGDYTDSGRFVLRTVNIDASGRITREGATFVSEERAKEFERFALEPWDTLFVMVGATLGKTGLVKDCDLPALLNQNMWVVRAFPDKVDPRYLHYAFTARSKDLLGWASGAAREFVRRDDFRTMELSLPPRRLQDQIANFVGAIDDKIELNRQINQTLEQIAQAIFKSWFVDFEPIKAKIEAKAAGRDPERAAMCAISGKSEPELDQLTPEHFRQLAATAALFPDALVESELGLIPVGWEVSIIGNEVDVVGGGTPSTKHTEYWEDGRFHWTTPKDLSNATDKILLTTERKITKEGLSKISSGLLPVNTVLMSSRAPVGYLALAKVPVAINQGYIAMKCNQRLLPNFVLQWTNSVMDEIKQRASGTTFAEISKKNFRLIQVVVAKAEILDRFEQISEGLYSKIAESITETTALTEVRDALLPKLLSGEIDLLG